MRVIEQKGEYAVLYSRYLEPIAHVKPGEEIMLQTEDAYRGFLKSEDQNLDEVKRQRDPGNPQVGPIYIDGAEVGDTLKIHILNIEPIRDTAVSCVHYSGGGLTPSKNTPMLGTPNRDKIFIYHMDDEGYLRRDDFLRFPWKPFLGCITTAPDLEALHTGRPFENGGNMDVPDVKPGNIIYLPVSVDGAYFFTGDCHANQGQGELCGTALEIAAKVTLKFELIKGKKINWPRIESPDEYMVVGSARPMEDAARIAYFELLKWMMEFGWDELEAYQALTQAGKLYCANMVDPNYSMVAKVSKKLAERRK